MLQRKLANPQLQQTAASRRSRLYVQEESRVGKADHGYCGEKQKGRHRKERLGRGELVGKVLHSTIAKKKNFKGETKDKEAALPVKKAKNGTHLQRGKTEKSVGKRYCTDTKRIQLFNGK